MIRRSTVISVIMIILLGWYWIQAIAGLAFSIELRSIFYLAFTFVLLFLLITKKGIGVFFEKRMIPVLVVWLVYVSLFRFHALQFPSVAKQIGLPGIQNFIAQTIEYIALAIIIKKKIVDVDLLLYRLFVVMSCFSFAVLATLILKFGPYFYLREAYMFGGGVSLITFSYNAVFCCILGFYLLIRKDLLCQKYNCNLIKLLISYSTIIVLLMGKRGAVLSLFVPILAYFFFRRLSVKKSLIYLCLIVMFYFFVVNNIDFLFDFLSVFSKRLAEETRLAYYMGDANGREFIWEVAIDQFNRNRLMGFFPRVIDTSKNLFFYGLHPHNYWLEALMTMGLIGSVPFFGCLIYVLLFKFYRAVESNSAYCFWAMLLVSEIIHGTFSSPLNDSIIWGAMFVLCCYSPQKTGSAFLQNLKTYAGRQQ